MAYDNVVAVGMLRTRKEAHYRPGGSLQDDGPIAEAITLMTQVPPRMEKSSIPGLIQYELVPGLVGDLSNHSDDDRACPTSDWLARPLLPGDKVQLGCYVRIALAE